MPRTPLLASLVRRLASSATPPVAPTPGLPTRRHFLGSGGAAALAVAFAPRLRTRATARIAVVGGGLAGLTCAFRLQQRGIAATVYEARARFGGRCWTARQEFAAGQLAEHGGELIDQGHVAIRHLTQELGLPLVNVHAAEPNGSTERYRFFGSDYDVRDAARDLRAIWSSLHADRVQAGYPTTYSQSTPRGRALDAMSIADWITQTVPGGLGSPLGQLLATAYTIEYGEDVEQQSALNLIYLLGYSGPGQLRLFGPSNEKYKVVGGNDRLPTALATALPDLRPEHRLLAVQKLPSGRIRLTFATPGGTLVDDVDHAVFAVPFAVLASSVDLTAADWSARKRLAIAQLGRGANTKLNVQFATRHWSALGCNGGTYSDLGYQTTWEVTRGQAGTPGILVDFTGGTVARSFAGADPVARAVQFAQQLEPVLPGSVAGRSGPATLDVWHADPFSGCSYSYFRVGQYQAFAGVEGEPEGNAWFCGEHTSRDAQGYLEGAVETGERAAEQVRAAIGG